LLAVVGERTVGKGNKDILHSFESKGKRVSFGWLPTSHHRDAEAGKDRPDAEDEKKGSNSAFGRVRLCASAVDAIGSLSAPEHMWVITRVSLDCTGIYNAQGLVLLHRDWPQSLLGRRFFINFLFRSTGISVHLCSTGKLYLRDEQCALDLSLHLGSVRK
jgi:hypothetical protein